MIPKRGKPPTPAARNMRKYSNAAITVSTPNSPRKAHELRLTKTPHTTAHKNSVLEVLRTKVIALPDAAGGGDAAMNGGIQDARAGPCNSFHQLPRNQNASPWFHCRVRNPNPQTNIKPKRIMKTTLMMTLSAMIGSCLAASAQDGPQRPNRPNRPQGPPPPELVKEFDKDGDGKLSEEERKAMRETMQARMEERRKEMLEKFDTDKDGKLSPEEQEAARAARHAEMLKKYDKDGDGKLSDEERAAMPKPPRRPGGPGGPGGPNSRRGPGGPGGPGAAGGGTPPPAE